VLNLELRKEGSVTCLYAHLPQERLDEAAHIVACGIVTRRVLDARLRVVWTERLASANQGDLADSDQKLLVAGLLQNVGVPGAADIPAHLYGLVAEEIWLQVVSAIDMGIGTPIRVEGHDYSVTDPGGDGLTIHDTNGTRLFRLWESKYHGQASPVRETVQEACRQLRSRGLSYLTRFSHISQRLTDDPALAEFYCLLPQKWVDNDPAAGAAVVIGTSAADAECFESVPTYFELAEDSHHGQLNALGDFPRFAQRVRELLWRGCGWTAH
jgi:hypothetical protein